MTRHESREAVFQLLYEKEFHADKEDAAILVDAADARDLTVTDYIRDTYYGVREHIGEIDATVEPCADNWKLSRMSPVTRSLLRLAVYEFTWGEVPPKAAINEAIDIAKAYDDAAAPKFINGILNRVARAAGLISDEGTADA